jgi:hypothetical protein
MTGIVLIIGSSGRRGGLLLAGGPGLGSKDGPPIKLPGIGLGILKSLPNPGGNPLKPPPSIVTGKQ